MKTRGSLILASNSPRRQELLRQLGLTFRVWVKPVEEDYPEDLHRGQIALFLASRKAAAYEAELQPDETLITADTIVCLDELVLNKPADYEEACRMLRLLSGQSHDVITGVCLHSPGQTSTFFETTRVSFKPLSPAEIHHYVSTFRPYDKAGSYGIQEWIGMIGIEKIEGSYFNVMGLPVHRVYEELVKMGAVFFDE
ncbi:Maf-like protein [soil metagenome]